MTFLEAIQEIENALKEAMPDEGDDALHYTFVVDYRVRTKNSRCCEHQDNIYRELEYTLHLHGPGRGIVRTAEEMMQGPTAGSVVQQLRAALERHTETAKPPQPDLVDADKLKVSEEAE